jgi:hypothetical protein
LKTGKHLPATSGLNIYRNTIAHGLISHFGKQLPENKSRSWPEEFLFIGALIRQ